MTAKLIGIGKHTGFEMMVVQDTMTVIGLIKVGCTIIEGMNAAMITGETMTVKMIIGGIFATNTAVTIHQCMIAMINGLTKVIDIMIIGDPMINVEMMIN